jgi:hypothetical protein
MSVAEELVRNGSRSGRGRPWKDRTHCLRGHPYTPENILWRPAWRQTMPHLQGRGVAQVVCPTRRGSP